MVVAPYDGCREGAVVVRLAEEHAATAATQERLGGVGYDRREVQGCLVLDGVV